MLELIDRYALKDHLYQAQAEAFKRGELYVAGAIQAFINLFDKQPTIEAEPVVHCKDCVYYHKPHVQRNDGTECDISEVKGITLCADCAYYNMRTHKCKRGATREPDLSKGDDVRFFTDCPLTDAEPVRHGRWIPVDGEPYAICSYCGEKHYGCTTPYCDMCGAYMRTATDTNVGGKGCADNG